MSALDVSVQAQILNMLRAIQRRYALSILFISHDLSVVRFVCDRVGVMYLGEMVELAETAVLFREPRHPYTQALLAAIPEPTTRRRRTLAPIEGEIPSPIDPPVRLPLPPALPARRGDLPRAEAGLPRAGTRPSRCLPLRLRRRNSARTRRRSATWLRRAT